MFLEVGNSVGLLYVAMNHETRKQDNQRYYASAS